MMTACMDRALGGLWREMLMLQEEAVLDLTQILAEHDVLEVVAAVGAGAAARVIRLVGDEHGPGEPDRRVGQRIEIEPIADHADGETAGEHDQREEPQAVPQRPEAG